MEHISIVKSANTTYFMWLLQFRLHIRNPSLESDHYFHSKALLQEYIMEMWLATEHSWLRWIRDHQASLRADLYTGVIDALHEGLHPSAIGRKVILPSSFTSGPRFMQKNLQHALTLLRVIGPSDLFITFTANPHWKEITDNLLSGQSACDRPDIVARVFHLKFISLLHDIMKNHIFGKAIAYVYTVEYQKRGLPHIHLIVFLDRSCRLTTPQRIDSLISSELPDPVHEPVLFELVKTHMIHGPCRPGQCLNDDGFCSKGFPKPFQPETEITGESYVKSRRRDNGRRIHLQDRSIDNQHVVAHSPYLLWKYRAHINVECTSGFQAIKYIYKVSHKYRSYTFPVVTMPQYIYKGPDRASVAVHRDSNEDEHVRDEIKTYIDARYVSSMEAYARIMGWPTHKVSLEQKPTSLLNNDGASPCFSGISCSATSTNPSRKWTICRFQL